MIDEDELVLHGLPAEMLCFSVYSASHAFTHLYRQALSGIGLTYPQYLVMLLLWRVDGRTVKDIGRHMDLESNTLTPLLKRLEGLGLIRRTRDRADERVVRVQLTEAGRQLEDAAREVPACIAAAVGLGAEEVADLARRLRDLRKRLLEG
ncbi:MarR family winged helix-turn-helix transcriptional regulator [Stappia sp.]|uniref:MarR family winged helix-turn-helix transcriptional regulator n=1 Tax=Stappia sp. TaxID=1870903 RepID=UPI003A98D554